MSRVTHYTIDKDHRTIEVHETDKPTVRHRYVPGHDLGAGWTRHIVQLDDGDTADNPMSTKGPIRGPGVVVYDCHATGITVRMYDSAKGFYDDVVKSDELQRLYEVANDYELTVLEDLAVRAGLRWICPVRDWTNVVGERCGDCGRTQDEAEEEASDEVSDELLDPEGAGYVREPPWDDPPYDDEVLRAMSDREIRRAQDIVRAQIPLAHAQGNTEALTKLQKWGDDYAAEMRRRLDEGLVS